MKVQPTAYDADNYKGLPAFNGATITKHKNGTVSIRMSKSDARRMAENAYWGSSHPANETEARGKLLESTYLMLRAEAKAYDQMEDLLR